jgi:hypothetical protein
MEATTTYKVEGHTRIGDYDCMVVSYIGNLYLPIVPSPTDTTHRRGIDRISMTGTFSFAIEEGFFVSVREKWVIDGDREKIIGGKMVKSKVSIDTEVTFDLKNRKL